MTYSQRKDNGNLSSIKHDTSVQHSSRFEKAERPSPPIRSIRPPTGTFRRHVRTQALNRKPLSSILQNMKQNIYDDPVFFERYSSMARSRQGLEEAGEWPVFRALLPYLADKKVLDLGCGFGWHCRYAAQQEARRIVGIDLSEKMLTRARETTDDPRITYRHLAIEDLDSDGDQFDVVISSLAFHYIEHFDLVCQNVNRCLVGGGWFVFSVEHPIFTANGVQDWCYGRDKERQHWPVDSYLQEGARNAQWLADNVVKYHRTIETYLTSLIEASFSIQSLREPKPEGQMLQRHPEWADELRRPMFLIIAAVSGRTSD